MRFGEHPTDDLSWWFGGRHMSEPTNDEMPEQEKRPYTPPKLTIYGTLDDLTKDGGTLNNDGLGGSRGTI